MVSHNKSVPDGSWEPRSRAFCRRRWDASQMGIAGAFSQQPLREDSDKCLIVHINRALFQLWERAEKDNKTSEAFISERRSADTRQTRSNNWCPAIISSVFYTADHQNDTKHQLRWDLTSLNTIKHYSVWLASCFPRKKKQLTKIKLPASNYNKEQTVFVSILLKKTMQVF